MPDFESSNKGERLVVLEGEFRALKEVVERFIIQATLNNEKLNEKLDEVIKANSEKPSFTHCSSRKDECEKRFADLSDKVFIMTGENVPVIYARTVTMIISGLMFLIGVLGSLLAIACKT